MIHFVIAIVITAFISYKVGVVVGADRVAKLAWSLLEHDPRRSMVAGFLLYAYTYCIGNPSQFKNIDDRHEAYKYLKIWEKEESAQ